MQVAFKRFIDALCQDIHSMLQSIARSKSLWKSGLDADAFLGYCMANLRAMRGCFVACAVAVANVSFLTLASVSSTPLVVVAAAVLLVVATAAFAVAAFAWQLLSWL